MKCEKCGTTMKYPTKEELKQMEKEIDGYIDEDGVKHELIPWPEDS